MRKQLRVINFGLAFVVAASHILPIALITPVSAAGMLGSGTPEDPYQIADCGELQSINEDLESSYELVQDIDCSETASWNSGEGFYPIGGSEEFAPNPFVGNFNGNNHVISDLYINQPDMPIVGLFATVAIGSIKNVQVNGTVSGGDFTGGVVGLAYIISTIENVQSDVDVSGVSIGAFTEGMPLVGTGGVVGLAIGDVPDGEETGGVSISRTISTGNVEVTLEEEGLINSAGGLAGMIMGKSSISDSYTTSRVVSTMPGQIILGGAVGAAWNIGFTEPTARPTISNSYSTGVVEPQDGNLAAGFIGIVNNADVQNSFTASPIDMAETTDVIFGNFLGVLDNEGTLTNNYIDVNGTQAITCVGEGGSEFGGDSDGCTGVNYEGGSTGIDPDYFLGNNINPPLNVWDFECTWATQEDEYPDIEIREGCTPDPEDTDEPDDDGGSDGDYGRENTSSRDGSAYINQLSRLSAISSRDLFRSEDQVEDIDLDSFVNYTDGSGYELKDLKVGQVLRFSIVRNGVTEQHSITIKAINDKSVDITVASTPFDMTLVQGASNTVSIDGLSVMSIDVTEIGTDTASLHFTKITAPDLVTQSDENSTYNSLAFKPDSSEISFAPYFVAIGLIVVLAALIYAIRRNSKNK